MNHLKFKKAPKLRNEPVLSLYIIDNFALTESLSEKHIICSHFFEAIKNNNNTV